MSLQVYDLLRSRRLVEVTVTYVVCFSFIITLF